jgi:hypothetical protein
VNKIISTGFISALCLMLLSSAGCDKEVVTPTKDVITVTAPTAGQKLLGGDTVAVKWAQSVSSPVLSYSYDGTDWLEFASVLPVSATEKLVKLPIAYVSETFQIRVEDSEGTLEAGTSDSLNLKFIVLSSPTVGQTFTVGQSVTIAWRTTKTSKIESLRLMLSDNKGISFQDILTKSMQTTVSSYTWVVGSEDDGTFSFPNAQCIIKLRDYNNDDIYDDSPVFSVQK